MELTKQPKVIKTCPVDRRRLSITICVSLYINIIISSLTNAIIAQHYQETAFWKSNPLVSDGSGRNDNKASEVFARWLHHRQRKRC